ncbi:hypothetical protein GCM10010211_42270 [Streptomyces albospinus]|uniref:Uncharacterized protein n=1 Tax=Streptomyces albospinus TaxID=285515 RepID=A0ABQ2VA28_9ACTN|nr:hypothetical protein GCM10010211_42270 [Streptomyces albospinus]
MLQNMGGWKGDTYTEHTLVNPRRAPADPERACTAPDFTIGRAEVPTHVRTVRTPRAPHTVRTLRALRPYAPRTPAKINRFRRQAP